MSSVYSVERVVLFPICTPRNVGIGQEEDILFAISACCYNKVKWDQGKRHWYCSLCDKWACDSTSAAASCVKPLADSNGKAVDTRELYPWIAKWTGLGPGEFLVRVVW